MMLINIIVLLSIINSGSLFVKALGDDTFYLLELLLVVLLFIKKKNINFININHFAIFTFLIFFHAVIYASAIYSYIGLLVRLTSIFLLASIISSEVFWEKYNKIIVVISVFSLIGFVAINLIPDSIIHQFSQKYILRDPGYGGPLLWYNNLFFITWPNSPDPIIRNQSIFWEPGAFQFFVNIALIMNLRFTDKLLSKRNIIYIITILTTFSTTGYFVLTLILLDQIKLKRFIKKKYFIPYLALFCLIILIISSPTIRDKFSPDSQKYKSYYARMMSTINAYEMIKKHPIIGFGYGNESIKYINQHISENYGLTSIGGSNNLLMLLGQMGLIIGFIYFYPLFTANVYMRSRIIYILVMITFLSTENFATCHIVMSLMYFSQGLKRKNL